MIAFRPHKEFLCVTENLLHFFSESCRPASEFGTIRHTITTYKRTSAFSQVRNRRQPQRLIALIYKKRFTDSDKTQQNKL